jgi:hypothetical protein
MMLITPKRVGMKSERTTGKGCCPEGPGNMTPKGKKKPNLVGNARETPAPKPKNFHKKGKPAGM